MDRMNRRHPGWIRSRLPAGAEAGRTAEIIERNKLGTVCREAHCPNMGECWSQAIATIMVLGDICTGACRFCSVKKGIPAAPDPGEPERVATAVAELGLRHVVVTSVTRGDLPDGGAGHFAAVAASIRERCPNAVIELLVPDFAGSMPSLDKVLASPVDILGHNVETVPRLYPSLRPLGSYSRALKVLAHAARAGKCRVKSAILLGMGESRDEIRTTLADILGTGCSYLAIGQYLRPSINNEPVARYLPPEEFGEIGKEAREAGFIHVESGPMVRSSYHAGKYAEMEAKE